QSLRRTRRRGLTPHATATIRAPGTLREPNMEHIATTALTIPPIGETPPGNAPSTPGSSLNEVANAWVAVIACLSNAYPTSRYATMSQREATSTALAWHRSMADVPAHGVIPLYDRTMGKWTSSFPPTLGDFKACWLDWETFWLDTNGEADDEAG